MKSKFFKLVSIFMILFMVLTLTSCSKEDKIKETVLEEEEQEEEKVVEKVKTPEEVEIEEDPFVAIINDLDLDGGIKDVYEQVGILAGTCISNTMINDETLEKIILDNFSTVTLENEMKPDALLDQKASFEKGEVVVTFQPKTIKLLDWAKDNEMTVRGHVLIWFDQTPNWLFHEDYDARNDLIDREEGLIRMESYIRQVFEQLEELEYSDMFISYDVVNEALEDDGVLKASKWLDIIGEDYIWHAFNFANQYAPDHIKLYYNDYNEQFKLDHVVELVSTLVDENGQYLIDGIGCQGHLYTYDSVNRYVETLMAFKDTGLDVEITELDVALGSWQTPIGASDDNLRMQGDYYYRLISTIVGENFRENTNISSITFWGFADNLSWKRDRHPLLFDEEMNPKYSYYGAKLDKENVGFE